MGSWEPPSFQAAWAFDIADASSEWASTPEQKHPCTARDSILWFAEVWGWGQGLGFFVRLFYVFIFLVFIPSVTCHAFLVFGLVWCWCLCLLVFSFDLGVFLLVCFIDKGIEGIHSTCFRPHSSDSSLWKHTAQGGIGKLLLPGPPSRESNLINHQFGGFIFSRFPRCIS